MRVPMSTACRVEEPTSTFRLSASLKRMSLSDVRIRVARLRRDSDGVALLAEFVGEPRVHDVCESEGCSLVVGKGSGFSGPGTLTIAGQKVQAFDQRDVGRGARIDRVPEGLARLVRKPGSFAIHLALDSDR